MRSSPALSYVRFDDDDGREIRMYSALEKAAEIIAVMAVPAALMAMLAWGFAFGAW